MRNAIVATALVFCSSTLDAQTITHRGFIEGSVFGFPQVAPNDSERLIGDVLFREEVFLKPSGWIHFAGGLDLRANSHGQVEHEKRLDFSDRTLRRPLAAVRRLSATITAGRFTVDVGKQFIRWGRTDIVNPTDRFAPRDYLNVIDSDFLPVLAVRPAIQMGQDILEVVWAPQLTPSRLPLVSQRWTVVPPAAVPISVESSNAGIPRRPQYGVRWNHAGSRVEFALSYFDGLDHLPSVEVRPLAGPLSFELARIYPEIRTYGGDLAIPTGWMTLKVEAAYFTSQTATRGTDEYVLYVFEIERQVGEWTLVGGYAGDRVTRPGTSITFSPERGIARSILARAAYTVDPRRTVTVESAARQTGNGLYVKGEYSEAMGQHWRLTVTGVTVAGEDTDFLGQYRRNSHGSASFRFSF